MFAEEKKTLKAYKTASKEAAKNLKTAGSALTKSSTLKNSGVDAKEKKAIKKAVKAGKEVNLSYFTEGSSGYNAAVKYNEALKANVQATQDLANAQEEYNAWLVEAAKMKFDNIATDYENAIKQIENNFTDIDNRISEIEMAGKRVDKSFYESQKSLNDQELAQYKSEKNALEESIKDIKQGTQEWYDAKDAIQECENAISKCTKTTYELNNAITQLHYDMFNDIANGISRIISEQEFLQGLFAHEKLADDDTGGLTEAGIAKLGSLSASYYASKVKVNNDEKEVEILRNMLNNKLLSYSDGDFSLQFNSIEDLEAKYHEMYDTWQNDITETYNLEKEIFDVMEQKYQAELAYVNSLIDAKKEALQVEKDLHDYQNSINEKVTDINTLQRQISAYQGDSSEEGMAKLHSLQKQLNDAQKDLQETEYDKYISDQQDMLEKLSTEYEEAITNQLEDFKSIVNNGFEIANNNLSSIDNYLSNVANANGYTEQYKGLFSSVSNAITGNTESGGTLSAIATNVNLATDKIVSAIENSKVKTPPTTNPNNGSELLDVKSLTFIDDTVVSRQDAENERINQVNAVKNFIAENAVDATKSKSKYTDVNQKIYEDKAEAYGGKGKILKADALRALGNMLGVAHNNGSKTGNLYKKLQSIKFPGFSKGGVVKVDDIEKQVKANGDNVLISARKDETILSPAQSEMFKKFTDNLPQLNMTAEMFNNTVTLPKIPNMTPIRNMGNNVLQIDTVTLPNVTNWEEFKDKMYKDMQSNRKFEGLVQDVSINRLSGGGRLSKNRQKF